LADVCCTNIFEREAIERKNWFQCNLKVSTVLHGFSGSKKKFNGDFLY
jgi:hypothetical protein